MVRWTDHAPGLLVAWFLVRYLDNGPGWLEGVGLTVLLCLCSIVAVERVAFRTMKGRKK